MTLETPKQLAARVGLKERQIRSLIDAGKLEYVMIGCRKHIPVGAFERFIEQNRSRLKWHRYGAAYYICWTERGRSRERSTGTASREQAEIIFAEWLQVRGRKHRPSDPSQVLVTDVLTSYANERAPRVTAPRVIGCAIDSLSGFWQGRTVVEVIPHTCGRYSDWRVRSQNTIRRELAVLQAAINYAYRNGRITRPIAVTLPAKPPQKNDG